MTGPVGNSEICFLSTSLFPSASPRGTLRVSKKQNSPVYSAFNIQDKKLEQHDSTAKEESKR